ncbi:MAG: tetratricopeptide (TPR) repeat protein [Cognaticolwellia sp.]|jgi:tetratricopeptide (TPR) repeat protein
MGLFSWLFPSDTDRVAKGHKLLQEGAWAQARDEVIEVEGSAADEVRALALDGLKRINLELAVACAEAGEMEASAQHMKLAASFAQQGDAELRAARRSLREFRSQAKKEEAVAMAPQSAGGALGAMGVQSMAQVAGGAVGGVEGDDPIFSLPPDHPKVRFALMLERYGDDVAAKLESLGPDFAKGAMALEEGAPAAAFGLFAPFTSQEPLARWFRAQAALLSAQPAEAILELRAMHRELDGPRDMAGQNSAAVLAGALVQTNQPKEALEVLDAALKSQPKDLGLQVNRALVLETLGKDEEADELARRIVQQSSRVMEMYKLMARCRVRAGKRMQAMQALEAGLVTNCTSGKCGSLPFDVQAGRELARLYLEDRLEPLRAAELIGRIHRNVPEPGWLDGYLDALTARNSGASDTDQRVANLSANLKPGDRRLELVQKAFAKQITA